MAIITYDGEEFKSIDCIPEYVNYPTIYVAKAPHVDELIAWANRVKTKN